MTDLNVDIETTVTKIDSSTTEQSQGLTGGVNLGFAKFDATGAGKDVSMSGINSSVKVIRNHKLTAINELLKHNLYIIIDDFHYIDPTIQKSIIRAFKTPIFQGLRVITLAVPHRAFDSLKVETEMTGRVIQLPIDLWAVNELKEIANKGFEALNLQCEESIIDRLATECYGSPHLMQSFCHKLCEFNKIEEAGEGVTITLKEPPYSQFFKEIVEEISSKVAFERLAKGPRQRADRVQRELSNGETVDIYEAILHGIAETGPKTKITYEEIRNSLKKVLTENIPQGHEITRVLSKMDEIAKERLQGEPVLDWDKDDTTLYISDPFFAFYLRWAVKNSEH